LAHGGPPLKRPPPAQSSVPDREVKQFERGIVVGETAASFDDLAERPMERLNCICRVDHLADAGRKREERHDMFPGATPSLPDCGVPLAPFGFKFLESDQRYIGVLGPVNRFDPRQD
jgi:hypothetical protein